MPLPENVSKSAGKKNKFTGVSQTSGSSSGQKIVSSRPEAILQRKVQDMADNSEQVLKVMQLQQSISGQNSEKPIQRVLDPGGTAWQLSGRSKIGFKMWESIIGRIEHYNTMLKTGVYPAEELIEYLEFIEERISKRYKKLTSKEKESLLGDNLYEIRKKVLKEIRNLHKFPAEGVIHPALAGLGEFKMVGTSDEEVHTIKNTKSDMAAEYAGLVIYNKGGTSIAEFDGINLNRSTIYEDKEGNSINQNSDPGKIDNWIKQHVKNDTIKKLNAIFGAPGAFVSNKSKSANYHGPSIETMRGLHRYVFRIENNNPPKLFYQGVENEIALLNSRYGGRFTFVAKWAQPPAQEDKSPDANRQESHMNEKHNDLSKMKQRSWKEIRHGQIARGEHLPQGNPPELMYR